MNSVCSLDDWLFYIENLHHKFIDLGLYRVRKIAIELDLLHPASNVILVGGTNGKGTTCALLETILLDHGLRVGVYSSPHLLSYTERVRINGFELSESIHVSSMSIIDEVRLSQSLTYFEFTTLSCLYLFKQEKLDVLLLEVGLGGRLDATNVVDPDISVITNIAIDHVNLLGSDHFSIAKEKFGILRYNKPAVVGNYQNNVNIFNMISKGYGSIAYVNKHDWFFSILGDHWSWWSKDYEYDLLPIPKIPIENAAVVLAVICILPYSISRKSINYGLKVATLPGRFQIIRFRPLIILDVAHNPHATYFLSKRLENIGILGKYRAVVGMLSTKNIFGSLCMLYHLISVWYCSSLDCSLSVTASQLARNICNKVIVKKFSNVCDAFDQAILDASYEDCIIVFGSFHAVSPVLKMLVNYDK